MASTIEGCFPGDVVRTAPVRGESRLAAKAVTSWSTPAGPVLSCKGSGQKEE
jgi:hypothetical protein